MAAIDLTTLADVRAFLQEPAGDTQQDAIIGSLITRASRTIMVWTGREFAPKTDAATRKLHYRGGGHLDLGRWELRAATSVTLDSDQPAPITLVAGTDYALRPLSAPDGVYQWLELPTYDSTTRLGRQVTIVGDWGWPSVPDDVAHACIVTVALWLKRDVSAFSRTFNLDEGRTERPDALPSAVTAILAPYRALLVG
jgi:uncharacterized phiE125 gp8 family phage protein